MRQLNGINPNAYRLDVLPALSRGVMRKLPISRAWRANSFMWKLCEKPVPGRLMSLVGRVCWRSMFQYAFNYHRMGCMGRGLVAQP